MMPISAPMPSIITVGRQLSATSQHIGNDSTREASPSAKIGSEFELILHFWQPHVLHFQLNVSQVDAIF